MIKVIEEKIAKIVEELVEELIVYTQNKDFEMAYKRAIEIRALQSLLADVRADMLA